MVVTQKKIYQKEKHISDDGIKFKKMKIKKIIKTDKESQLEQIKLAEQYLINKLDKHFGINNYLNDYNNDGTIAQRGGA